MIRTFVLSAAALLAIAVWAPQAEAGTHVSVGIGVGGGYYGGYRGGGYCGPYGRPYYGGCGPYYGGYGGYGYYRPYYAPVYYAPPPVYVQEPVYVQQPVQQVPAYSPTTWQVTQVQSQLGRLHYYPGSADGVMGPMTRNAIASFQQSRGLAVTGNINYQVLNALEIPM